MRGRYNSENKTEQKVELNNEEISNSITTVQKDSMVIEMSLSFGEYIIERR